MEQLKEWIRRLMEVGLTNEQANAILLIALQVSDKVYELKKEKDDESITMGV